MSTLDHFDERTELVEDVSEHPAYLAWKRLYPASARPVRIESLKSTVFRLWGVTGANGPVIAKRLKTGESGSRSGLPREARLYTGLFETLDLQTVQCFGCLREFDGCCWLLLEDAGDRRYSFENPAHYSLAMHWMARLHSTPSKLLSDLCMTGPAYFLSVLQQARRGVQLSLVHPALKSSSTGPLETLLDHLHLIEDKWGYVEQACLTVPETLVHGDFAPKNIRVRGSGRDARLVVIDWETAGVAVPAADVAMIPRGRKGRRLYVDLMRGYGISLNREDVERMYRIGQVFRLLHSVEWKSRGFRYAWIKKSELQMLSYQRALEELVCNGRWLSS